MLRGCEPIDLGFLFSIGHYNILRLCHQTTSWLTPSPCYMTIPMETWKDMVNGYISAMLGGCSTHYHARLMQARKSCGLVHGTFIVAAVQRPSFAVPSFTRLFY